MLRFFVVVAAVLACSPALLADEIFLHDGSRLVGQVTEMSDQKVSIETEFVGQIEIDVSKIRGIVTESPMSVELESGDRTIGKLIYSPDGGQKVMGQAHGIVDINMKQVSAVWAPGDDSPEMKKMKDALAKQQKPWSTNLQFGIDGQSGNTDRVAINGRMEVHRTTDEDRLMIYAQGRSSRENGEDTVKEILGGLNLEVDIDKKRFWFARTELEFDKFENLDLRTSISGGVGHFVTQKPNETFKVRAGVGFTHESFDSGNSDDQAVADLGWDYRKELSPTLVFTHSTTIFPTFEDINDFRAVMENAFEIPLSQEKNWNLKLGVRNNYDAMPEKGVERLDTYYYANIGLDWQ